MRTQCISFFIFWPGINSCLPCPILLTRELISPLSYSRRYPSIISSCFKTFHCHECHVRHLLINLFICLGWLCLQLILTLSFVLLSSAMLFCACYGFSSICQHWSHHSSRFLFLVSYLTLARRVARCKIRM